MTQRNILRLLLPLILVAVVVSLVLPLPQITVENKHNSVKLTIENTPIVVAAGTGVGKWQLNMSNVALVVRFDTGVTFSTSKLYNAFSSWCDGNEIMPLTNGITLNKTYAFYNHPGGNIKVGYLILDNGTIFAWIYYPDTSFKGIHAIALLFNVQVGLSSISVDLRPPHLLLPVIKVLNSKFNANITTKYSILAKNEKIYLPSINYSSIQIYYAKIAVVFNKNIHENYYVCIPSTYGKKAYILYFVYQRNRIQNYIYCRISGKSDYSVKVNSTLIKPFKVYNFHHWCTDQYVLNIGMQEIPFNVPNRIYVHEHTNYNANGDIAVFLLVLK